MQWWHGPLLTLLGTGIAMAAGNDEPAVPHHYTADGFRNPHAAELRGRFFRYLRTRYFGGEEFPDYQDQGHRVPQQAVDLDRVHRPDPHTPQVTWIGHTTVLLQYRGVSVLTDPIFSQRASPLRFAGPRRHTPPALTAAALPTIDYVVISHNHYDHLDLPSVTAIGNRAIWLVPLRLKSWLLKRGLAPDRVYELDWWQRQEFQDAVFTATPAQHFSGRALWDHAETLWASWAIRIDDFDVWFGGDTGYNPFQFKRIGDRLGPFELGLIPIGAYLPRWFMKDVHVNPAEAVRVHHDVRADFSIGVHWGAFQLSAEEIDAPMLDLARAARTTGARFVTIAIGETRSLALLPQPAAPQ